MTAPSQTAYLACRAKHKETGEWWYHHWDSDKSSSKDPILMREGAHNGYNARITVEFLKKCEPLIKPCLWFCDLETFEIVRVMETVMYGAMEKVS